MSRQQLIANTLGTFLCLIFVALALVYFPYKTFVIEGQKFPTLGRNACLYLGLLFILLGIIGIFMCSCKFIFVAKGSPIHGDSQNLIVCGLYRFVRNPFYISAFFILLGESILFQSTKIFYYLIGFMVLLHIVVVYIEEPFLRIRFGESYDLYCKSVHRWVPRFSSIQKLDEWYIFKLKHFNLNYEITHIWFFIKIS